MPLIYCKYKVISRLSLRRTDIDYSLLLSPQSGSHGAPPRGRHARHEGAFLCMDVSRMSNIILFRMLTSPTCVDIFTPSPVSAGRLIFCFLIYKRERPQLFKIGMLANEQNYICLRVYLAHMRPDFHSEPSIRLKAHFCFDLQEGMLASFQSWHVREGAKVYMC